MKVFEMQQSLAKLEDEKKLIAAENEDYEFCVQKSKEQKVELEEELGKV